ncbi:MAG: hypothetical protein V4496_03750 [Pseudomonadota bacterium]
MTSQTFALRLNTLLDRFNFPQSSEDREITFSEYFHMPQTKAKMILTGMFLPRLSIIEKMAEELFIDVEELVG